MPQNALNVILSDILMYFVGKDISSIFVYKIKNYGHSRNKYNSIIKQ